MLSITLEGYNIRQSPNASCYKSTVFSLGINERQTDPRNYNAIPLKVRIMKLYDSFKEGCEQSFVKVYRKQKFFL